jgi:hypothetical protein
MKTLEKDLWSLIWGRPEVDPQDLFDALVAEARQENLDYRTRWLIRDSCQALREYWGDVHFDSLFAGLPERDRIESIVSEEFERVGFPSLRERMMEKTEPQAVEQFFRDLSSHVRRSTQLAIGGSIALILPGHLIRRTDDIAIVDEVPEEIRNQHQLLADLRKRYGLLLTHFQRHYLPMGWENRLHYHGSYGSLTVYLLDIYDIFLSKLFSARTKDLDDLRLLAPQIEKETLTQRLRDTTASMLASESLRKKAETNWYIVYGDALPT